jgi:hypothetical protein
MIRAKSQFLPPGHKQAKTVLKRKLPLNTAPLGTNTLGDAARRAPDAGFCANLKHFSRFILFSSDVMHSWCQQDINFVRS